MSLKAQFQGFFGTANALNVKLSEAKTFMNDISNPLVIFYKKYTLHNPEIIAGSCYKYKAPRFYLHEREETDIVDVMGVFMNFLRKQAVLTAFSLLAFLVGGTVFAGGAPEMQTRIQIESPELYISPLHEKPEFRTMKVETIKLQIPPSGTVKQYRFTISDRTGRPVYENTMENLKDRGFIGEAFGIGEKPGVTLPTALTWDGKDHAGKVVSDGAYLYQVVVIDSWGRTAMAAPLAVMVDTKPPVIDQFTLSNSVVSPNGDGRKDQLRIRHNTSSAYTWVIKVNQGPGTPSIWEKTIKAEGSTESTDLRMGAETLWPESASASQTPAGSYMVILEGTDRAGNMVQKSGAFEVSYTNETATVETRNGKTLFSSQSGLEFLINLAENPGAESWQLSIIDGKGITWRQFKGQGQAPTSISYEGQGVAGLPWASNGIIADGSYKVEFIQNYANGTIVSDDSLVITFDNSAPKGRLGLTEPDLDGVATLPVWFGGSNKPLVLVEAELEAGVNWEVQFLPLEPSGTRQPLSFPIAEFFASVGDSRSMTWDGALPGTSEGKLPAGEWVIRARAVDAAGNEGITTAVPFVFDPSTGGLGSLVASSSVVNPWQGPNPSGTNFSFTESPSLSTIETVTITVADQAGKVVFNKDYLPLETPSWYGQRSNGLPLEAADYRASATVRLRNGEVLTRGPLDITVIGQEVLGLAGSETRFLLPVLNVSAPALIETSAKGRTDFAISVDGLEGSNLAWKVKVLSEAGKELFADTGKGSSGKALLWTSPSGEAASPFEVVLELPGPQGTTLTVSKMVYAGIPVQEEGSRLRIMVPDILFDGNMANTYTADQKTRQANLDLLRRLGAKLSGLDGYRIVIEGHATPVWGTDAASFAREQERELIPLSLQRAQEVRKILFTVGVEWADMEVQALGGSKPAAPTGVSEERWKNRRVVLYLEKN